VLEHVLVLVNTACPLRVAAVAAEHRPFPPASLGRPAVRRHVDQRPEEQLRVEPARRQPLLAAAARSREVLGDGRSSAYTLVAENELAVLGEQRSPLVPAPDLRVP